jgi:hypothetical protein
VSDQVSHPYRTTGKIIALIVPHVTIGRNVCSVNAQGHSGTQTDPCEYSEQLC